MKDANRSKTNIESPSRRNFLRLGGACAALTATPVLSTLLNLQLTKTALAATSGFDDYKALVCVFLFGGNDSYNMLVPNEDLGYSEYAATRSNLALPRNDLLPITDPALDPGAFGMQNDSGLEAMLANIRNFYMAGATEAPIGFMSPLTA